jgi:hypothetical protein
MVLCVQCSVSVVNGQGRNSVGGRFDLPGFWGRAIGTWSSVCITIDAAGQVQVWVVLNGSSEHADCC